MKSLNRTCISLACASLSVLMGGCRESGPLVLAERGRQSTYAIVLPPQASPCLRHAGEELAKYLEKMTGTALAVQEAPCTAAHAIRIRRAEGMDFDSFRFRAEGRDFVIEGESDRATLFGVYDFLETQCGCEWWTSKQEYVPRLDRVTVAPNLDLVRKPTFRNRECSWTDAFSDADFCAKLKLNGYRFGRVYGERHGGKPPAFDPVLGICHTTQKILPAATHFKDHPEWYAEVKGVRRGEGRVQLCLSNPEVLARTIEFVRERIRQSYPAVKSYGISQDDTMGYCTCAKCRALDEREGTPAASIVNFVNQVADAVAKDHPDVIIETLAYMYSRTPPKTLRCRDNVMVTLCTDTCDLSRPMKTNRHREKGRSFAEDLAKWQSIAKHIYIWDYALNFYYMWHTHPNLFVIQPNYEFFSDNGVTEVYMEGAHHGLHAESAEIKLWITAHVMWDAHQPFEPLFERFLKGFYGAAAPFARKYYEDLDSQQTDESQHPHFMWALINSPVLPDAFYDRAAGYWRDAMAAVKGDARLEENVRWAMNMTDYTRIMRGKPGMEAAAARIVRDYDSVKWPDPYPFGEDTKAGKASIDRLRELAAKGISGNTRK